VGCWLTANLAVKHSGPGCFFFMVKNTLTNSDQTGRKNELAKAGKNKDANKNSISGLPLNLAKYTENPGELVFVKTDGEAVK
jgi:hypothetical protein